MNTIHLDYKGENCEIESENYAGSFEVISTKKVIGADADNEIWEETLLKDLNTGLFVELWEGEHQKALADCTDFTEWDYKPTEEELVKHWETYDRSYGTATYNYIDKPMLNEYGSRYGTERLYFPESLQETCHRLVGYKDTTINNFGNDAQSEEEFGTNYGDVWSQEYTQVFSSLEEALNYYWED